jgi:hypothetical protein
MIRIGGTDNAKGVFDAPGQVVSPAANEPFVEALTREVCPPSEHRYARCVGRRA